jgi:plastocyanin
MTRKPWCGLILGLALVGAACGDESSGGPGNALTVSVQDNIFSPMQLTVPINSTVTFVWGGMLTHNVTYIAGPMPLPTSSGTIASGIFMTNFGTVGTYDYLCTLHSGMTGRIVVTP